MFISYYLVLYSEPHQEIQTRIEPNHYWTWTWTPNHVNLNPKPCDLGSDQSKKVANLREFSGVKHRMKIMTRLLIHNHSLLPDWGCYYTGVVFGWTPDLPALGLSGIVYFASIRALNLPDYMCPLLSVLCRILTYLQYLLWFISSSVGACCLQLSW